MTLATIAESPAESAATIDASAANAPAPVLVKNIPACLTECPRWVAWRYERRGQGKATKVPYDAKTGRNASSTDPDTWAAFQVALAAYQDRPGRYAGIGFVLADPFAGIDLDNSLDDAGRLLPWAREQLDPATTYGEVSPSGRGVKLIGLARLAGTGINIKGFGDNGAGGVEVYDQGRFFTVTGRRHVECPADITECQEAVTALYQRHKPRHVPRPTVAVMPADVGDRVKRCLAYLETLPDAISGQGGHNRTLHAACECFRFGLGAAEVWSVMDWYNQTKTGGEMWSEKERRHKIKDANKKVGNDFGVRLREVPQERASGATRPDEAVPEPAGDAARSDGEESAGGDPNGNVAAPPRLRAGGRRWAELDREGWPIGPDVVRSTEPMRLAEHFLRQCAADAAGSLTLRRYRQEWWRHAVGYRLTTEEELAADIYQHLDGLYTPEVDKGGDPTGEVTKLRPKSSMVREVMLAIPSRGALVTGDMPQWLDGRASPAPADVVAFRNGLLDAAAYCRGEGARLIPPTPEWFGGPSCPYDFDTAARCDLWLRFVEQSLGDAQSIALLQEWLGLMLVPDNRYERLMMLVGRPRAGKGTVLEVMLAMLGLEQAAITSFTKLALRFGIHPLVAKLAAVLPDAHIGRSTDDKAALEAIKSITGGDPQAVDRKGVHELPLVRLACRFTIAVNELPRLPDDASALKPRLLLLYFPATFAGREDTTLKLRLRAEAPGVALWALEGLRRLRERGTFTVPERSQRMVDEFERTVSPVKNFLFERAEVGAEHWIPKDDLYNAWAEWCRSRRDDPGNLATFGQKLIAAEPAIHPHRRGPRGAQFTTYEGVRLCQ